MAEAQKHLAQHGATQRHNIFSKANVVGHYLRSRNELDQRQRNAIELMLRGMSDLEVAAQIGVDRGTVYRWRNSVAVQRELDHQRRVLWERSAGQIQSLVGPALAVLRDQLASRDEKTALRAAGMLLRFATPSRLAPAPGRNGPSPDPDPQKQLGDALIAYIDAPLPGQSGAIEPVDDDDECDNEQ